MVRSWRHFVAPLAYNPGRRNMQTPRRVIMPNADPATPFTPGPNQEKPEPLSPPIWANIDTMRSLSPLPGITMWPVSGSNVMINFVRLEPNAVVPLHHHHHEQAGTVIEGMIVLTIDGETRELRQGDAYVAAPHALHGAQGGPDGCLVVDVFSPPREDYILPPE
jgi:quercetin dioxygenase-like cupin family protein